MTTKPTIGFIGVGYMGHGMSKNILQNGYDLWVMGNRNRTPVDSLVAMGANEATSLKDMAEHCDIIHLCLSNSKQVEQVIRGNAGLFEHGRSGQIIIDTSTSDPTSTLSLAADLAQKGIHLVDAPLGRTPKEAEAGTLDAMVGADQDVFNTVSPVIDCWAGSITHVGAVGSGHKMKLLMNFLAASYAALYSEATVLGAKVGISPHTFRQVIGSSRLGNGFFDTFMQYVCDRDENAHKFTIENMSKDIRYVNAMANDAGTMNVMAAAARHYYTHAQAVGGSADFVPMLSDHVGRMNGLDLGQVVADTDKKNGGQDT